MNSAGSGAASQRDRSPAFAIRERGRQAQHESARRGDHLNADLEQLEPQVRAYAAILDELRVRGICRTSNNPVADYSEWLVASRLGLDLCKSSSKGFDATGPEGVKYQIKARRVTASNASVQLGAIRGLDCRQFDYMVAVLFESDFSIRYALKIPHEVVVEQSKFRAHTNAHIFHLRRTLIDHPKVEQVTERLR